MNGMSGKAFWSRHTVRQTGGETADHHRFGNVTGSLTSIPTRRDVLRGLVGAGLGLGSLRLSNVAAAKKETRRGRRSF